MEVVAAGPRTSTDDAACCASKLSVVILCGDLKFANGVQGWVDDNDSQQGVAIFSPVRQKALNAIVRAVRVKCQATLGILRTKDIEGGMLHTRGEQSKSGEVASEIRQLLYGALVKNL